jgi:hypothetical protein
VWSSPGLIESNRGTDDKLFFVFFTGLVTSSSATADRSEKPIHLFAKRAKVERVVLNALVKPVRLCRLVVDALGAPPERHFAHSAIGFGIVFGRLRRGYGAPGEKPIHLWLSVRRWNGRRI